MPPSMLLFHSLLENQMLSRGIMLAALIVTGATALLAWKKEAGWIASCTAAGCPGMRSPCLTYVAGGKMFYCYRNQES